MTGFRDTFEEMLRQYGTQITLWEYAAGGGGTAGSSSRTARRALTARAMVKSAGGQTSRALDRGGQRISIRISPSAIAEDQLTRPGREWAAQLPGSEAPLRLSGWSAHIVASEVTYWWAETITSGDAENAGVA